VSLQALTLLQQWRGQVVLVRTFEGERLFGAYFSVSRQRLINTTPEDYSSPDAWTVDLQIQRVTYVEAV
jgi:hypothetical protein